MIEYRNSESESISWLRLSHLRNFQFLPLESPEFFVEPYDNRERADCSIIHPSSIDCPPGVYFFVDEDDFAKNFSGEIMENRSYLYGAYGQINVLQLRVLGQTLLMENEPQKEKIRSQILSRIEERSKTNVNGLSIDEAQKVTRIAENGILLNFVPEEFAYRIYHRG